MSSHKTEKMAHRATKSGFALEAQEKIKGKYDCELAAQVMGWVGETLPDAGISANGEMEYVHEKLNDGFELCRLIQAIGGSGIKAQTVSKRQTMAFKKMECINQFCEAARSYGVPNEENFQTVDLYEKQNLWQVIICLQALARKAQAKGYKGFGPKEAEENRRSFTQEQMKAGQNVIGLQMGSNKGATQAGQNFGKSRMIVD